MNFPLLDQLTSLGFTFKDDMHLSPVLASALAEMELELDPFRRMSAEKSPLPKDHRTFLSGVLLKKAISAEVALPWLFSQGLTEVLFFMTSSVYICRPGTLCGIVLQGKRALFKNAESLADPKSEDDFPEEEEDAALGTVVSVYLFGTPAECVSLLHSMPSPPTEAAAKAHSLYLLTEEHGYLDIEKVNPSGGDMPRDEDLALHYGEGFPAFDAEVIARLSAGRKGLFVFHGPPGTGKTAYIRRLMQNLMPKKRVILVTREQLQMLTHAAFTSFLLGLRTGLPPVFVIEDAEEIVSVDARTRGPAVATLLGLTDGLMNDLIGSQAVVTFNCPVNKIDPALLRAGRLGGIHAFNPLTGPEARALAEAKGLPLPKGPATLAEVLANTPLTTQVKESSSNFTGFR